MRLTVLPAVILLTACNTIHTETGHMPTNDHPIPDPISTDTAEHYIWGDINEGWHLVKQPEISIIEERMAPGGREVRHFHQTSRQFFRVLEGVLTMGLPTGPVRIAAGEGLEIPPGTPHQAMNETGTSIRFLVISAPPSHGDRVVLPD